MGPPPDLGCQGIIEAMQVIYPLSHSFPPRHTFFILSSTHTQKKKKDKKKIDSFVRLGGCHKILSGGVPLVFAEVGWQVQSFSDTPLAAPPPLA